MTHSASTQTGDILFGSYTILKLDKDDGHLYLFGGLSRGGLSLARVAYNDIATISAYTYYNPTTSTWTSTLPSRSDSTYNVFASCPDYHPGESFGSGEIFYSAHHGTYLHVYMSDFDSTFRVRKSLDGTLWNWSDNKVIYTAAAGTFVCYAGHAFPGYDATGQTLMIGWTYTNEVYYNRLAKVEWA